MMAANLQNQAREQFAQPFRDQCTSDAGRLLAQIIDHNHEVMIQTSLLDKPALAALLPMLTPELVRELDGNDHLMRAFGHMVRLEMEFHNFLQDRLENCKTNWPFNNRDSRLAVFRRGEGS